MTQTNPSRSLGARIRRGALRLQLLVLLLVSAASGLLAQQLAPHADRLADRYLAIGEAPEDTRGDL
ncbi:hypothetical protein [Roseomonas sp. 18066]|uniref:hypothetical protein n=1 Tax=Roseomonas sp. 18066 TaxID=2681412 RepID=UPI00135BB285|nr:hypothetical protein [Roseomonas sp. 18066]